MPDPTDDTTRDHVLVAAERRGLDARGLTLLHRHATAVYLLPAVDAVARVHAGEPAAAQRAITVTRWLVDRGLAVTEPLTDPVVLGEDTTVTFWVHYPQTSAPGAPDPAALGRILRDLHQLPTPPVALPRHRPLASLRQTLATSTVLDPNDRRWLTTTADTLLDTYDTVHFPLGEGHLHGDAYPGNLVHDPTGHHWRLGDWDETCTGPRELDLVNTYQGIRLGRTAADLDRFADAYGYDLRDWPGLPVLRAIRDLHTLGSFLNRAAAGDTTANQVLRHRLHVLQHGRPTDTWTTS
ncbi:aminoglycoside phosphotransferase family protein [Actinokineospora inagensis]|uniref:aminoglycoside phosphotransferase family protein n=1 Tax=Actinokineospora inagensis TaxID=103730 RepID=UPI000416EF97|nr:aminoglycoside phosphotransferase family protein [Actinokineospora inagensis]